MESSRVRVEDRCREIQELVQRRRTVRVEWLNAGGSAGRSGAFRIDSDLETVRLDRRLVEEWLAHLPADKAAVVLDGLAYRSVASLLFSPPEYRWREAVEHHVRSEMEQGLDEDYTKAFHAANTILESHRLDQRILECKPACSDALSAWNLVELEALPAFEVYPRAAVIIGRAYLPEDWGQPVFDEFVEEFGVDEADDLSTILRDYIALRTDDVDRMVDVTHRLVFQAYPEAMGLALDAGDQSAEELWPFRMRLRDHGNIGWAELSRFVSDTMARFSGEAGYDFGDALIFVLSEHGFDGPRVGVWSRSRVVSADVVGVDLAAGERNLLAARGWDAYENAPDSLHKEVPSARVPELADEIIWLLRDLAGSLTLSDLVLWARGPATEVAQERGWLEGGSDRDSAAPVIASPDTWEVLASLVRDSLQTMFGRDLEEYEAGRFIIEVDGVRVTILTSAQTFPAIRVRHRVIAVPEGRRGEAVELANSLHGRSSTMGAYWWVGDEYMWQQTVLWAGTFHEGILREHLSTFIDIAYARTPEIRSRLGER